MAVKIFKFKISFITSKNDSDEVIGIIDNRKRTIDLIEIKEDGNVYKGFIPFSAIKKLEIISQVGTEEYDGNM
jgi:hypothetical protein